MKEGLLEKVRSVGHWRVNFRPQVALKQPLSLKQCNEVVEQSSVSIRGWDFPHISRRNDDEGGRANMGDYVESWTDWQGFHEFWRMYRSGQFVFFGALHEDTEEWRENAPIGACLNILSATYSMAEFIEFARRMTATGIYSEGISVDISLRNTAGRRLSAGRGRVPFFEPKINGAAEIRLDRRLGRSGLADSREVSAELLLELFDHFGWHPDPSQIHRDQEKFFRKEFGW